MSIYTKMSRREGLSKIEPAKNSIAARVLESLAAGEMTAEEISEKTGINLNSVRSRLTELAGAGLVESCGRKESPRSGIFISVWRKTPVNA